MLLYVVVEHCQLAHRDVDHLVIIDDEILRKEWGRKYLEKKNIFFLGGEGKRRKIFGEGKVLFWKKGKTEKEKEDFEKENIILRRKKKWRRKRRTIFWEGKSIFGGGDEKQWRKQGKHLEKEKFFYGGKKKKRRRKTEEEEKEKNIWRRKILLLGWRRRVEKEKEENIMEKEKLPRTDGYWRLFKRSSRTLKCPN